MLQYSKAHGTNVTKTDFDSVSDRPAAPEGKMELIAV